MKRLAEKYVSKTCVTNLLMFYHVSIKDLTTLSWMGILTYPTRYAPAIPTLPCP